MLLQRKSWTCWTVHPKALPSVWEDVVSLQGWSVSQQNSQTVIGNASGSIQLLSLNNLPSLKLTWHLKMDGWNTSFLLGWMKFSWAMFVSGRVPWSISKMFKPRMPCLELASYIRTPFRDRWKGLAQSCQANSFDKKQVTNNFFQVIQSDPFYTLVGGHQKPLKGSLNHPKRLTKNSQVCALLMYFSWRPSGQFSCFFSQSGCRRDKIEVKEMQNKTCCHSALSHSCPHFTTCSPRKSWNHSNPFTTHSVNPSKLAHSTLNRRKDKWMNQWIWKMCRCWKWWSKVVLNRVTDGLQSVPSFMAKMPLRRHVEGWK